MKSLNYNSSYLIKYLKLKQKDFYMCEMKAIFQNDINIDVKVNYCF